MRVSKFSALALATFTLQNVVPTVIFAVGTCSISALDTVAGLGTQVTLDGCETSKQVELTIQNPSGATYTQVVITNDAGNASALIPSKTTVTAGIYSVSALGVHTDFSVIADRTDSTHSKISASRTSVAAGGKDVITVTAVLRDRYDNPIASRPIALISNRASDEISPQMHQTDDEGQFLWNVRPMENGVMTLLPYDIVSGKQLSMRTDVNVGSLQNSSSWIGATLTGFERGGDTAYAATIDGTAIDHFEITLPQNVTEVKANELFSVTIRAMNGTSLVRGYIGSLGVTSSDESAELPKKGEDPKVPEQGRIDIRNVDQGERKVPLSFMLRERGTQTITVFDKLDPSMKGEITLTVVREDGADGEIVIVDPKDGTRIKGGDSIMLQGKGPSLINVKVIGGKTTVMGEIGADNVFRIDVPLNPEHKEITLFVTSENGSYESAPVHLFIDTEVPKIESVSMNPLEGKTEESATVTVRAEPDLTSVIATIDGKDTVLQATATGMYVGTTVAPLKEGLYDVKVIAKDSVGNEASAFLQWRVKPKTVPTVEGVSGEGRPGLVLLQWKEVQNHPIAQYKIYISTEEDPTNYLYSIGTQKPVTSAIVKDLPLGKKYLFSLTALDVDGMESSQKSAAVAASPLGFALRAKPGKDSVLLEWDKMPDLPLSSYTLEFGTEPGVYTEKRTVNGEATSVMVRDLIPKITYEFKMTAVAVTGKVMNELAAVIHVTLGDSGFTVGSSDPAPDDMFKNLHSGADLTPKLQDVPMTTTSGISTIVMGLILIGSVILGMSWLRLRRERRMVQDFLQSMQEKMHA